MDKDSLASGGCDPRLEQHQETSLTRYVLGLIMGGSQEIDCLGS